MAARGRRTHERTAEDRRRRAALRARGTGGDRGGCRDLRRRRAPLPISTPAALRAVVGYQAEINLSSSASFNLVPAFPLDGGRIARALLWRRSGDIGAATNTAAGLGRRFGYFLIAFGVLLTLNGVPGGLWLALIGVFIVGSVTSR